MRIRTVYILTFILVGFLATLPAFYRGFIPSHDILIYSNWHTCFSQQLISGDWYPRWLMDMNGGRGSPAFYFYPPLTYYISAALQLFVPDSSPDWYAMYLSFGLALGLSGTTSFILLKEYATEKTAFLLSIFYILAPYHLYINFYYRFAYTELWAQTWIPLSIYFLDGIIRKKKYFYVGFIITYAFVITTNLPTFIVLTPLLLLYALIMSENKADVIRVAFFMTTGILICAFYVLPMLAYQNYINIDVMWKFKFNFRVNFINIFKTSGGNVLERISMINTILMLAIVIKKPDSKRNHFYFWAFSGFLSIFMMTNISELFWDIFPLIHKIQFPWRLNIITLLSLILLCAINLSRERKASFANNLSNLTIIAILCAQSFFSVTQILPPKNDGITDKLAQKIEHQTKYRVGVIEYTPRWVSSAFFNQMLSRNLKDTSLPKVSHSEHAQLHSIKWNPGHIELFISSARDMNVTIRQNYFPTWHAFIDDGTQTIDIWPNEEGLIEFAVPADSHKIDIVLKQGIVEFSGIVISLLTIASLVAFQLRRFREHSHKISSS